METIMHDIQLRIIELKRELIEAIGELGEAEEYITLGYLDQTIQRSQNIVSIAIKLNELERLF